MRKIIIIIISINIIVMESINKQIESYVNEHFFFIIKKVERKVIELLDNDEKKKIYLEMVQNEVNTYFDDYDEFVLKIMNHV